MHHLLAVLSLATALVAPTRRQTPSTRWTPSPRPTTRRRAASLEKKGDYIIEDIAKNLGKGDQDRLYQYQLELAERYGEDKIGRAAPPPKPKKPKQENGREAVVKAVTTPPTTKVAVQRNSKLRWRGLFCGAAVALFLTPGFLEYLISVRTKALALEKSLEALVVAVAAPATDAVRGICGAAAPVCASAYGSVAAAAAGAYGAAAPACAKACSSVGAAASSACVGISAAAGSASASLAPLAAKVGSAVGSAYSSLSATKVGAAVTSGAAKAGARVGPPLARVWRFLVSWKGLIFWRPGS